jgi:hypothetical protein
MAYKLKIKYPANVATPEDMAFYDALRECYSRLKRQVFTQELSNKDLVFIYGNDKIQKAYTFSLPAGFSCPGALQCLSRANRDGGGLTDGPATLFRCFAASEEARLTEVRMIRWHNFDKLKECASTEEMVALIQKSMPADAKMIRVHVSGDYYNRNYFKAWIEVARLNPQIVFYSYTKSLPLWIELRDSAPANLRITASFGGRYDDLITKHNLLFSKVVADEADAAALGLEVDHDDTHAQENKVSFALVVHAAQPAGSKMSAAWTKFIRAQMAAPKPAKRVCRRTPTTIFQWICRILKMVTRLHAAGGTLGEKDLAIVADLRFEAGAVPSPAVVVVA